MSPRRGWLRRQLDSAAREYKQFPPWMRDEKDRNITPTQHMRDVVESIVEDMRERGLTADDCVELRSIGEFLISSATQEPTP